MGDLKARALGKFVEASIIDIMQQTPDQSAESMEQKLFFAKLATGQNVYDKPQSHIHHDVRKFVPTFLPQMEAHGEEFVKRAFTVPEDLPFRCVEVDPTRDELFLAQRVGRKGYTVFVRGKEPSTTNTIMVMLRRSDSYPDDTITPIKDGYTLGTAYAGEDSPFEPGDPYFNQDVSEDEKLKRDEIKKRSLEFWTSNALIPDPNEFPIVEGSERPFDTDLLQKTIS